MKLPSRKQIIDILRKRYGQILLSVILLIITVVSIRWGYYLLSNDNYSPELNPLLSISRYFESPAWRSYRTLGFASDSEQADIFRSIIFVFFSILLPNWSLAQFFSLLSLWIGAFSMAYLVTFFIRDFVSTKYSNIIFLISGIFYITTLWTAWIFNFNMMPYITGFGFLPLLLLSIYLLLKEWSWRRLVFFLLASMLFASSCVIATLFFVNIVLIVFFFIYYGWLHKVKVKKILLGIGIFLLLQMYWLLPFIQYTVSTSQNIIDSYTNRAITANTIDLEAQMMTLDNSARFYTRLLGTVDDPATDTYIFPMSEDFLGYDIYKVVGLLPILLSVIGLVFVVIKKEWKLLPLWFVLFGLLFLLKSENFPLGGIYVWLQDHFNIFKQVFRWVSSKLSQPYLIFLVITSLIGFLYLIDFLASFFKERDRKYFIAIPTILIVACSIFYSEYLFKGQLFTERALVNLPEEYSHLSEVLEKDSSSRVFYAPPANNGYFREYDWGFVGSQFLAYVIPNPIMDMSLAIGSDVGENAMLELHNDFNSGNINELDKDLDKYDIKYILVDRSLVKGRYGYELDWGLVDRYVGTWEKVWSENFLELYKVKENTNVKYIESLGSSSSLDRGSFVRKYTEEPVFSPLNLDLGNAVLEKAYLVKTFTYSGVNTILYSNYSLSDINNFPTTLKKLGYEVISSPAIPTINDLANDSYKNFILPSTNEYAYILDDDVYTQTQLEEGINIYNNWGDLNRIFLSSKESFKGINFTERLSESKPGDCSGGKYVVMPDIKKQEVTSGFAIEGSTDLPCLYTKVNLDKRFKYVGEIILNWESSNNTSIGYCLQSAGSTQCLNKEKFIYTKNGYGNVSIEIPKVINGGDDLSLIIYALNPKGEKASLIVRNVEFRYSNEIFPIESKELVVDTRQKILRIADNDTLSIKIPVFSNDSSYVYSSSKDESIFWQPNIAEDASLTYSISFDDGMKQNTQNQYLNQYQELFITKPLSKYLWYWAGENRKNIPASLCLTYLGDDKCWIDSTLFDDSYGSETRIFSSSQLENKHLDASFNSTSFKNETENVLKDFLVMEIPESWNSIEYKSIFPKEYTEREMSVIGNSSSSTFYHISTSDIGSKNNIVSIPQAKSDSWIAIGITDTSIKILPDTSRVYLDGWKQGWDISDTNGLNSVFVFYLPNLYSYLGYLLILVITSILSISLIKEYKKHARQ